MQTLGSAAFWFERDIGWLSLLLRHAAAPHRDIIGEGGW